MRIAVIHLSDIHFRQAGNPILARVDRIAAAVNSSDAATGLFLVIISGDVAYSGSVKEYATALEFFGTLKGKLESLRKDAKVEFVCVPGNHDCALPEADLKLRDVLVRGAIPSMVDGKEDQSLLTQILRVQRPYKNFRKRLTPGKGVWDGVCETLFVEHGEKKIQVNLYNTAILSRRDEQQGQLYVPLETLRTRVTLAKDAALCLSVFHHSYLWIESNTATAFRNHIERTSDVALMGHQHYSHSFYKENDTGQRVLYLEADALQDENYPQKSGFQILVFDLDSQEEQSIKFRWAAKEEIYRKTEDSGWRPLTINRAIRAEFRPSVTFQAFLDDVGTPLWHGRKGSLKLRDVFVFPDVMVRPAGGKSSLREVRGEDLLKYVMATDRILFQAPGLGGKTSLAKILLAEILSGSDVVPIFLNGEQITAVIERRAVASFWRLFTDQYGPPMLEAFQQLGKDKRALLIDNWSSANLNAEGRKAFLDICSQHFGKILLFADELFQIQELIDQSPSTTLEFEHASVQQLGHGQRGHIIDRWVALGREHTGDEKKINREIEEKERLIRGLIGKNTLPSIPFVVLCILEAEQEGKAESTEAGSFGYLYEVLVTTALSATTGPKAQLEKKYAFLARLSYQMFKLDVRALSLSHVKEIAEKYSESVLVKVDIEGMLADLEASRVLVNIDGNYAFAYPHLFHYFVARSYKENLDRENGPALREEISRMADYVSSDKYSTILMFIIYFARDASGVVRKLVDNANRVYANESPASLETDVAFLNQFCEQPDVEIPEKVDVNANREDRREFRDRMDRSEKDIVHPRDREYLYSEDLSDKEKFDLAYKHIELLGQVIRNFPGSLPGPEKLAILKSSYLLGLRTMSVLLRLLESSTGMFREALLKAGKKDQDADANKFRRAVDGLMLLISRICVLVMLKKVSGSVGVPDLEGAYHETLQQVGRNNATQLIDLSIKLDHFEGFPDTDVRQLHKLLMHNAFADWVLADLVMSHIAIFGVDFKTRQSMTALFKVKANTPMLMDPARKK